MPLEDDAASVGDIAHHPVVRELLLEVGLAEPLGTVGALRGLTVMQDLPERLEVGLGRGPHGDVLATERPERVRRLGLSGRSSGSPTLRQMQRFARKEIEFIRPLRSNDSHGVQPMA